MIIGWVGGARGPGTYDYFNLVSCSLPPFTPPQSSHFIDVIQDAFVIAVVSFAVGVSLAKVFAREFDYNISPNQVNN